MIPPASLAASCVMTLLYSRTARRNRRQRRPSSRDRAARASTLGSRAGRVGSPSACARRAFDHAIVASDLERAVETARIVGDACGLVPSSRSRTSARSTSGSWTGKSYDEIAQLYPEEWAAWSMPASTCDAAAARRTPSSRSASSARCIASPRRTRRTASSSSRTAERSRATSRRCSAWRRGPARPRRRRQLRAHRRRTRLARPHRLHAWNDTAHLEGLLVEEQTD